jgi:hypothetical protein
VIPAAIFLFPAFFCESTWMAQESHRGCVTGLRTPPGQKGTRMPAGGQGKYGIYREVSSICSIFLNIQVRV